MSGKTYSNTYDGAVEAARDYFAHNDKTQSARQGIINALDEFGVSAIRFLKPEDHAAFIKKMGGKVDE